MSWLLVMLWVLAAVLSNANAEVRPGSRSSGLALLPAKAAVCHLKISGGSSLQASISCSSGSITAALGAEVALASNSTKGVKWDNKACDAGWDCLLKICATSQPVIFLHARVMGVIAYDRFYAIVCAAGRSNVTLKGAVLSGNQGTVLRSMEQSTVMVTDMTVVANNTKGSSLVADGNSTMVVTGGTRLVNNSALGDSSEAGLAYFNSYQVPMGGALLAMENATVLIGGRTVAKGNVAGSGGAFAAAGYATLVIAGGTIAGNNTSKDWPGGGALAASDHAQVRR